MKFHLRAFCATLAILLLSSCSADTSLNQLFTQDGSQDRHDARLAEGRALYDEGEYEKAKEVLTGLVEDYPDSQAAVVLKSYAELGSVGLSFFDLLKLAILDAEDAQEDKSQIVRDCSIYENFISDGTSRGKLDCLLNVEPGTDIFKGKTLEQVRQENNILAAVDRIIATMCGFFDAPSNGVNTQRIATNPRHNCAKKANVNVNGKGTLIWAFAHLFEATILNVQLEYIQSQIDELNASNPTPSAIASNVGAVANGSIVAREALNDLKAVSNSLALVLGEDTDLEAIDSATSKLDEAVETAFGSPQDNTTGEILNELDTVIADNATDLQTLDAEERADLCEGYEGLGGDVGDLASQIGGGFSCD